MQRIRMKGYSCTIMYECVEYVQYDILLGMTSTWYELPLTDV